MNWNRVLSADGGENAVELWLEAWTRPNDIHGKHLPVKAVRPFDKALSHVNGNRVICELCSSCA